MTNQALDANRILAGVRAEVTRRRSVSEALETSPWTTANPSLPRSWRPDPYPIGVPPTLSRLLAHNGRQFLSDAYRALLGREPDAAGGDRYLQMLRSGERTRIDVLGSLAFSQEGRRRRVRVPGLLPRYLLRRAMRVPILATLLAFLTALVRLPSLAKNIRVLQEDLATLRNEQVNHQDRVAAAVEAAFAQAAERLRATNAMVAALDQRQNNIVALSQTVDLFREGEQRLAKAMDGFADRFRGNSDDIRARLEIYKAPLQFKASESPTLPIVDLACGRGELLQMLQANRISCLGVERDPQAIATCRGLGLPVEEADLFDWLHSRPAQSVAAITALHIVEHFPRPVLIQFLDECHRVLRPHGLLILETPNPANLLVGAWTFWLDPTHVAPLPDQLTAFLVERAGFRDVEIWPLSPRDARIEAEHAKLPDPVQQLAAHHLFGSQDYAVLGIA